LVAIPPKKTAGVKAGGHLRISRRWPLTTPRPDGPTNNLSPSLAHSLQPLFPEHQIVALRDKFPANIKDVDWIKALDNEGSWASLTTERRLKTRPHERLALDRSRIVFFFLTGAWLKKRHGA
jgi:hypothetical protein